MTSSFIRPPCIILIHIRNVGLSPIGPIRVPVSIKQYPCQNLPSERQNPLGTKWASLLASSECVLSFPSQAALAALLQAPLLAVARQATVFGRACLRLPECRNASFCCYCLSSRAPLHILIPQGTPTLLCLWQSNHELAAKLWNYNAFSHSWLHQQSYHLTG